jgi:hypothetical protein
MPLPNALHFLPAVVIAVALGAGEAARAADHDGRRAGVGHPTPRRVISLFDYYESGRRAVDAFVREHDLDESSGGLAETIRRAKQACVQLEIRFDHADGNHRSVLASGVVTGDGRHLLTAGHCLEDREAAEVVVTLPTGEARAARLVERRHERFDAGGEDWALLELIGGPVPTQVRAGTAPRRGDLVFILGYPDQIGIDSNGRLGFVWSSPGGYREPLTTLAVVEETRPLTLTPLAGSIPTGGASGGPVFDRHGRLVAISAAVSESSVPAAVAGKPAVSNARRIKRTN